MKTGKDSMASVLLRRWYAILLYSCLLLASLCSLQMPVAQAGEESASVSVYLFWVSGCPHCQREIKYLQHLQQELPATDLQLFEITTDGEGRSLFLDVVRVLGITEPSVPLTIIGNHVWMGYAADMSTGQQMRDRIEACLETACPDAVAGLVTPIAQDFEPQQTETVRAPVPEKMHIPLLGDISPRDLSLPMLTIILGALDGFNPCAMWTLVFLIGLLLGMKDTMRMWMLGGAFIIGSASVYFVFMAAWLNLLLFLGSLLFIRVIIGLVALAGGFYYLREYFLNKDAVCPVTASEKRQRVFQQLKTLAQERSFLLALTGIMLLAFIVNLVELVCSAGIPAVYTQILVMHDLPTWQYYGYLLLYILVFMADDMLVFASAMLTLQLTGITKNYSRYSHLIGGVLLLIIGALMLLRPDLLTFV
ncbi:MAG: hypothetical protein CVU26_03105 [Betaproteobacteria bacterium HGW-Betaproteobacteria-2]|nr:MAG: hypothetical protein CVU26_03105 [Betaproteobacteria bacterium HGW-Betaproteobacteria-2]